MKTKKTEEAVSLYYSDEKVRKEIDKLLAKNAALEASLGKDSSTKEIVSIKIKQERLFNKIKIIDEGFYNQIITDND